MVYGKYYRYKENEMEYSQELRDCISKACQNCIDAASYQYNTESEDTSSQMSPIMMLGKIQSGKTRAFIGLISLAFDNDFDMVFVLTKNSVALATQTVKRMKKEFSYFIDEEEVEIFDIMNVLDGLTDYELSKKLIIVAKKEKKNLVRISNFIRDYMISTKKKAIVIDDEADTTGIGFQKVKDTEDEFDLRKVSAAVNEIRGSLEGCSFVQVTATPYALYLQPDFNGSDIKPIRPAHTVLVPSGEGYIGGDYYFMKAGEPSHPGRYIYEEVSEEEHQIISLQREDRRRFKNEEILIQENKLCKYKRSIMNFIIGGCILRLTNSKGHYSFIIHTNTGKMAHSRLEDITNELKNQLKNRNPVTNPIIEGMLKDSYDDIRKSIEAYGKTMPAIDIVKREFYRAIEKDYLSVTVVNSDNQILALLNEDSGELRLRTPLSIFVGGQVLDRGVTIPNLIGFYYGRNPKQMQQDTVMQHSRMFGYRNENLLSVTRLYTTSRIYECMVKITEIDTALREDIENGTFNEGVYFIQRDEKGRIIPCAPNKVSLSNIVMLKPKSRILPIGFSPVGKTEARKISDKVARMLLEILPSKDYKNDVVIDLDQACELIESVYKGFESDDNGLARFVELNRLLSSIRYLAERNKKIHLFARWDRNASKWKDGDAAYQDAPDTPKDELGKAREVAIDNPALILLHQSGVAKGWAGAPFWWPVLVVQKNFNRVVFAKDEQDGKLRKKDEIK